MLSKHDKNVTSKMNVVGRQRYRNNLNKTKVALMDLMGNPSLEAQVAKPMSIGKSKSPMSFNTTFYKLKLVPMRRKKSQPRPLYFENLTKKQSG